VFVFCGVEEYEVEGARRGWDDFGGVAEDESDTV